MRMEIQIDHQFEPSPYCDCSTCNEYCHYHYGEDDACLLERHMHKDGAGVSGIRDVPLDEVFTWREEFGQRAKEAFGGWKVDCSPATYADLKDRCERLDREADPFFEHVRDLQPVPWNGVTVHMVRVGEVPDGVLRGCRCGKAAEVSDGN